MREESGKENKFSFSTSQLKPGSGAGGVGSSLHSPVVQLPARGGKPDPGLLLLAWKQASEGLPGDVAKDVASIQLDWLCLDNYCVLVLA